MKIKLIIIFLFLALPIYSFAITESEDDQYIYSFHLYYDNGQLSTDRDFDVKYSIVAEAFTPETLTTQFPYRGEIINFAGEIAANFQFNPKQGKNSVNATYIADGQKVVFYDSQNQPVLTIPVSDSSFCNDDGICNADRGEDSLSCPKDCKQSLPVPIVTTPTPSVGGSNGLWSGILYALGGLVLLGLGWWFFKRRGKSDNITLPPPPPAGGSTSNFPSQQNKV